MPRHLTMHNNFSDIYAQLTHINNVVFLRMASYHSPPIPHLDAQNVLSLPFKPSYNLIGR